MVWLDRADSRPAVIRLGPQLGKATDSDVRNPERVWMYLWETRGQTQMIYPKVMDQMDILEAGGCLTMSDSDRAGGEAGERRSLSGMVSCVKVHGYMWPFHYGCRRKALVALSSDELADLVIAAT